MLGVHASLQLICVHCDFFSQLFCKVDRIKFSEFINLTTFSYASVFQNKPIWCLKTRTKAFVCRYWHSIVLATALCAEISCLWWIPERDLFLGFNYTLCVNFYRSSNSKLLLRNEHDFSMSRALAILEYCVCDACLCWPVISVLLWIKAVAKAFKVLILLSVVFAYSWCLAFVCIF